MLIALTYKTPGGEPDVPGAQFRHNDGERFTREQLQEHTKGCDALVSNFWDRVDDALLDATTPELRIICNFAVGYDNIDVPACTSRGVLVCNTPDAVTEPTADLAWMLLLGAARGAAKLDRFARSSWYAEQGPLGMCEFWGRDITGRNLLIVGGGRIGFAVAMRSIGWGMPVRYVDQVRRAEFEHAPLHAERIGLDEGLAWADFVSIHVPLTDETRHLIDGRRLSLMKETAVLINTSRGPVVDEAALAVALREHRIHAAGLDVYEHEPNLTPDLAVLDNVMLTPHVGSAT
ncbi:MAG: D-glycerate dehydrogenase, partial [Phycisphaerales bacterium]|nr:D-glycerate dehydrogenase [Phycisphaerales bacterium]